MLKVRSLKSSTEMTPEFQITGPVVPLTVSAPLTSDKVLAVPVKDHVKLSGTRALPSVPMLLSNASLKRVSVASPSMSSLVLAVSRIPGTSDPL